MTERAARRSTRARMVRAILALAAPAAAMGACELLEEELPTAGFVSWPELAWQDVPEEHREYLPVLVQTLEAAVDVQDRQRSAEGVYSSAVLLSTGAPPAGVTIFVSAGADYAELAAFHVQAPGSGCIVRLGARRLEHFENVDGAVPARYSNGMRLPDEPGSIECMRTRPAAELRPRITRREL